MLGRDVLISYVQNIRRRKEMIFLEKLSALFLADLGVFLQGVTLSRSVPSLLS